MYLSLLDWMQKQTENAVMFSPTLTDAPLQLSEDVRQQDFTERLIKLREDVTDGVERMVTRRRHPLGFLMKKKMTRTIFEKEKVI